MAGLIILLGLIAAIMLFRLAINFNKYWLIFIPLVGLTLLAIYNLELLTQLGAFFVRRCLIWVILALAASLFLARNWEKVGRLLFCSAACIAACVIPTVITGNTVKAPVSAEDLQTITEATAYRHQGDGLRLEGETLSEFQTMMEGLTVKEDFLEQSRNLSFDDRRTWYCVDAMLENGKMVRFAFFPQQEGPDLMRVETDGKVACYQAQNEGDDLGGDWINRQIGAERRKSVIEEYGDSLRALKNSFSMNGAICSFTVPDGLPENLEIIVIGLPDEKNTVVYFLEEQNGISGWTPGETYFFDVSEYGAYRYLYLSAKVDGEDFGLVNIFEQLPEERKSKNPQNRFFDAGI